MTAFDVTSIKGRRRRKDKPFKPFKPGYLKKMKQDLRKVTRIPELSRGEHI
jgi:hypothetical protein